MYGAGCCVSVVGHRASCRSASIALKDCCCRRTCVAARGPKHHNSWCQPGHDRQSVCGSTASNHRIVDEGHEWHRSPQKHRIERESRDVRCIDDDTNRHRLGCRSRSEVCGGNKPGLSVTVSDREMPCVGMDVSVTVEGRELVAQVACARFEECSDQARLAAVRAAGHDDADALPFDGAGMDEKQVGMVLGNPQMYVVGDQLCRSIDRVGGVDQFARRGVEPHHLMSGQTFAQLIGDVGATIARRQADPRGERATQILGDLVWRVERDRQAQEPRRSAVHVIVRWTLRSVSSDGARGGPRARRSQSRPLFHSSDYLTVRTTLRGEPASGSTSDVTDHSGCRTAVDGACPIAGFVPDGVTPFVLAFGSLSLSFSLPVLLSLVLGVLGVLGVLRRPSASAKAKVTVAGPNSPPQHWGR